MPIQIPLTNDPASSFEIQLEGLVYTLEIRYNTRGSFWACNILLDSEPLVNGLALLAGPNLLAPYNLDLGVIVMYDVNQDGEPATSDDIGEAVIMIYFSVEEIASVNATV